MKKSELLTLLQEKEKQFYDAGLKGNTFEAFQNLTADTTEEEESDMIDCYIDKYCEMNGKDTPSPKLREAMQIFNKICILSYLEGLTAQNLSKESSPKKESA